MEAVVVAAQDHQALANTIVAVDVESEEEVLMHMTLIKVGYIGSWHLDLVPYRDALRHRLHSSIFLQCDLGRRRHSHRAAAGPSILLLA